MRNQKRARMEPRCIRNDTRFECVCVGDTGRLQQQVLLAHEGPLAPRHVFDDVMYKVPKSIVESLFKIQALYQAEYQREQG